MTTELDTSLRLFLPKINTALNSYVPEDGSVLIEAARYSLMGGGKRFRPLLVLAMVEALEGSVEKALPVACAIEMIHTYSLIHDDLPCMDNDDYRRGRPTLHKVYREGIAVLAGDFLLTEAFSVVANDTGLSSEEKIKIIQAITTASSAKGLIGGQVLDLEAEQQSVGVEELSTIHLMKTGALIQGALASGAISANASPDIIARVYLLGYHLGLAFQIWDDVLDVTKGVEKHGVEGGRDQAAGKSTYVSHFGLEKASKLAIEHTQKAVNIAMSLSGNKDALIELIRRVTT